MRRLWVLVAVLGLLAAACGDSGDDPADDVLGSGTSPGDTIVIDDDGGGGSGTTITLPIGDGSEITVIQGDDGAAVITIDNDTYEVPLDQCAILPGNLLVSGETDEIAFGLVTGVGLAMTVNPNDVENSVAYVVAAPEVNVDGNRVSGSGEVQGVTAAGFGDSVPWSIQVTC